MSEHSNDTLISHAVRTSRACQNDVVGVHRRCLAVEDLPVMEWCSNCLARELACRVGDVGLLQARITTMERDHTDVLRRVRDLNTGIRKKMALISAAAVKIEEGADQWDKFCDSLIALINRDEEEEEEEVGK